MGIPVTSNFDISAPGFIDSRSGPYTSSNAATSSIDINFRYKGLTVFVSSSTEIAEYWWRDGVNNDQLIIKTGSGQIYYAGDGIVISSENYISASLGDGLEFDNDDKIQATVRTVNLQIPTNGNIPLSITNTITGPSSSLSGSPFFLPDTYSPRPPVSGTIFVVSGDIDANKNGEAYIFVTSSTQPGSWQQIFGFNETTADLRYVRLSSDTTQNISSSLNITGLVTFLTSSTNDKITFSSSLYWLSGSHGAATPGAGVISSVVVLGNDGKLYITGAYGVGGTPGTPLNSIQYNSASVFAGDSSFLFTPPTTSSIPENSSLLNLLGRETISGSLVLRNPSSIAGSIYTASAWTSSLTLQVIGTSSFTGSLIVSSSSNVIGTSRVSGSLIVSNSLSVVGTASISGSLIVSRSTDNAAIIVGSGSINPLLNVLGSQGQLFSVYDTLSGSLFSVNDISGLPILEVKSDITTLIGSYQAPALHTSRRIVTTVGSNIIYNGIPTASYNAAIIDYNITSASNAKVGSIMTAWSGSLISTQTEYATASFGVDNFPTMSLQISGANLIVTASATSANWVIKTIIRSI